MKNDYDDDEEDDEPDPLLVELLRAPRAAPLNLREFKRPRLSDGPHPSRSKLVEIYIVMPQIRGLLAYQDFSDLQDAKNNGIRFMDEVALVERIYKELDVYNRIWKKA